MCSMGDVVLKDSRDVFLLRGQRLLSRREAHGYSHFWEFPFAVTDQQASFPASSIAHDDEFLRVRRRLRDIGGCRHSA